MTFGARTFQGMSNGPVITTPTASMINTSLSPGARSTSFTLKADGTITYGTTTGTGSTAWANPTGTGTGTGVWAKVTITSNTGTTLGGMASTGAWTSLATDQVASFVSVNSTTEGHGTYTLSFATDSLGGNVIGSGSGSWDVGYTP